ncbi:large ribosomal subunit protein uL10m isoform X2 [Periplaneta americana]|uniref:large ribosomal subunit protein uL10m isoform X2 n=1 Tax=Periplaneta americana TaxID=6978 RepID=UPI0037E8E114
MLSTRSEKMWVTTKSSFPMMKLQMSLAVRLQQRCQTSLQFVRFRKRINIQRPAPPHYERRRVLEVCKPYYKYLDPRKGMSLVDLCEKPIEALPRTREDNPYERILAREMLNWFNHSRMIAFFHGNPISAEDRFKTNIIFKRNNMQLKQYGRRVATMALEDTKYAAVLKLFTSHNYMVFSTEPQVAKLIKLNRKIPQLVLMAGIVDDRFLSKNELVKYSLMPDLQTAQAGLVALLNSAAMHLTQNLTHHQQTLIGHLRKHVELQQESLKEDGKES